MGLTEDSGLRAALFPKIAAHLQKVARETGYTHPEYLSGREYPATEIPCLPETIAEQVVEKYLMEYLAPPEPIIPQQETAIHPDSSAVGEHLPVDSEMPEPPLAATDAPGRLRDSTPPEPLGNTHKEEWMSTPHTAARDWLMNDLSKEHPHGRPDDLVAALAEERAEAAAPLVEALQALVKAVGPYAFAPQHGTPPGTRTAVKRAVANAKRRLDGLTDDAVCGSEHGGFRCERPPYHSGKHRHSAALAALEEPKP